MRIGLVSDTHIPEAEKALPPELMQAFKGVDLILHAGDIYEISVLDDLQRIAPVLAASGDDDYWDTLNDARVKDKQALTIEGKTIWVIHQRPYYLIRSQQNGLPPSKNGRPDIVVFGHEHRVVVEQVNGILFVNPGSPTFLEYERGLGTAGILYLDSGKPEVHILHL
ncbi:MAG: metallophosphoesterase family protein [Chloroflexi bacterium]|nr:metallophosphoesterase family protein [Chloroflexota bacterium]